MKSLRILLAVLFCAQAAIAAPAKPPPNPPATFENVPYGKDKRQVLDFWKAPSSSGKPTPVVFYIHGGGWVRGNKKQVPNVKKYLNAGISVVSIHYRFTQQAQRAGVKPPIEWPLSDIARALQFVRSKADKWNIDKQRIAASGHSAGACSSLWLAFHADMADPKSSDAIARESTRLWCAAVGSAQTSLDPQQMKKWTPNSRYGGHAFGFMDPNNLKTRDNYFDDFLSNREKILPWIKEYSPYELASSDAPPIYLYYKTRPSMGKPQKDPTHTANFGVKLQEKLNALRVPCEFVYPGAPNVKHASIEEYLIETLKKPM
ncbi:carboxylesterase family protein [Ereboglobus luteus]|uniref:Lipase n=1 Tax=Ereboglobus luteus TaxID=1796921 RepID=A0A2U8E6S6_9BACT|nr:alpha/beta hydrolase [Ereboglobus luteus]AWI10242.1 lipase [Ereboglobus luteus]